ncbi:hypothetical protein O181_086604 [Austropuccinia psidii MF-1]|uniref:Uncharacterized protein n=1 Tax=Austropuccinia psidii MF-1 TaxID=1389203 RepID=A0A9Q3FXD8_9BASI|nr:hypothetical protein [Austropuccinia psidii MF-1]
MSLRPMVHGAMRPKGANGEVHQPPNHKWAHMSQFWPQNPINPKWPKTTLGPKLAINQSMASGTVRPLLAKFQWGQKGPRGQTQIGHKSVNGLWQPSEATRSAPSKDSPPVQGKTSLSSMYSVLKDQEGIIYHYAPFLLSNPMVTVSGPNYVIPNQVQNPPTILKKDISAIESGNSLEATRRPFKDPNHLALQRMGCYLNIRTIIRAIIRGYQYFQSLSRHQVFSSPCTTQFVPTGCNQASCMALA